MIRLITTFGGLGHLRPAPGTWGSLGGLITGLFIDYYLGFVSFVLITFFGILLSLWACKHALKNNPTDDPAEIVIDEVMGQWIALLLPAAIFWNHNVNNWIIVAYPGWISAFLFFRLFDIWKPWLVGRADRRHDYIGVVFDDLWAGFFAGLATCLIGGIFHGVS